MEKTYNPTTVENRLYEQWTSNGLFGADPRSPKPAYSIVIPPPNVTGVLHMGHALNNTVQDILIRYRRMKGFEALWMPGTDHAGIATQNVVERKLAGEGTTRHDLGRERFVEKVWDWKEEYHRRISGQLRRLGCSCDWDRERFTMDEGLSRAVRKVFVALYREGLVYRGKYIINWCPRCRTALSDEEAEHESVAGKLYHFRYPYADGSGHVSVATTRPETMLGDTAVAVNPADSRYTGKAGTMLRLPLANREIPIIEDDFVDREFGTGAVKVTPAHDPNDFRMGLRHEMEPVVVMDEGGVMCGPIPETYRGVDRFECRGMIVEDMRKEGLLEKVEDHTHAVGHCYRCHTMVEPSYSDQWFVKMKPLAEPALAAARDGILSFYPARWRKTYLEWMENIRDWCISRQIWWGHRIPVWYCEGCKATIVEEETPATCPSCGAGNPRQDEDVLDTWFSSWLWPFSTMGWPDRTNLLEKFYPTNVLVTAPEILFFWVARMLMAGKHFAGELPFTDIVLHGTVRDASGRKMSKSLGNAIDPLEIIETHGADALRFSLIMITAQGADVYLSRDTFDIGRNFANKLWNASRFLLGNIKERLALGGLPRERATEDRWILSRLTRVASEVQSAVEGYRLNEACRLVYEFTWHEYCDWYLEAKKRDLYQADDPAKTAAAIAHCGFVLAGILKLLHPMMPFVTEEIWRHLREKLDFTAVTDAQWLMSAPWPESDERMIDEDAEGAFDLVRETVTVLRTIRSENSVPPDKEGAAVLIPPDSRTRKLLRDHRSLIAWFARLSEVTVDPDAAKPSFAGQGVVGSTRVFLELEGLIDRDVEIRRLTKEISLRRGLVEAADKRLKNENFITRAPAAVVEKERDKYRGLCEKLEKLEKSLASLQDGA